MPKDTEASNKPLSDPSPHDLIMEVLVLAGLSLELEETHQLGAMLTSKVEALIHKETQAARLDEVDTLGKKYERVKYLKDDGIGTAVPSSLFYDRAKELKATLGGEKHE